MAKTEEEVDYKDLYIRALADIDNIRKRNKEKNEKMSLLASRHIIEDLIPLVEDMRIATTYGTTQSEWVMYRKMISILEKNNCFSFGEIGEKFDSDKHEAVNIVEKNAESGTISNVYKKGYRIGDEIISYAKVEVVK